MNNRNLELWAALISIITITLAYLVLVAALGEVPPASDLIGHLIGVVGFILMLMTEILYSIRKRSRKAKWGRMSQWLNFHIYTGIVGPYLVLLHTSWKFNGLAGFTLLLTAIIVISGFIGRYIYTAIPRSADGVELEINQIDLQVVEIQNALSMLLEGNPQLSSLVGKKIGLTLDDKKQFSQNVNRSSLNVFEHFRWSAAEKSLTPESQDQLRELRQLLNRQSELNRQKSSLALMRRMFSLWHTIHIPIGMVLFTAAFIHIIAAIYYATLLR
jgi:hypothetical protein